MKRLILCLSIQFLLLPANCFWGEPEIDVGSEVIDFGTCYTGYDATRRVEIKNVGTEDLLINSIELEAAPELDYAISFTLYDLPELPYTLRPYSLANESVSIGVKYEVDPPSEFNLQHVLTEQNVKIESNDADNPLVKVKITAEPHSLGLALGTSYSETQVTLSYRCVESSGFLNDIGLPEVAAFMDIILGVRNPSGNLIAIFDNELQVAGVPNSLSLADRSASNCAFGSDVIEGTLTFQIPESFSPIGYSFSAAVLHPGTNNIAQTVNSNQLNGLTVLRTITNNYHCDFRFINTEGRSDETRIRMGRTTRLLDNTFIPWCRSFNDFRDHHMELRSGDDSLSWYIWQCSDYHGDHIRASDHGYTSSNPIIPGDSNVGHDKLIEIKADGTIHMSKYY